MRGVNSNVRNRSVACFAKQMQTHEKQAIAKSSQLGDVDVLPNKRIIELKTYAFVSL